MTAFSALLKALPEKQETWLITGAAGFIGSHLAETLLRYGQKVRGLDNFSTGNRNNLQAIQKNIGPESWAAFTFMEGDIRDLSVCQKACLDVDYVLHQAALGSVPRSINDPIGSNGVNIDGFLNMLEAARAAEVKSFIYASSSSVYGDEPALPKREGKVGCPLSPYAVTKTANELYAHAFALNYNFRNIGLRYFNVFGERQSPNGPYAAVIPTWFSSALQGETIYINGDGTTSRDFCFIENCVQANLLAAKAGPTEAWNKVYNVAAGRSTDLNKLSELILREAAVFSSQAGRASVVHRDFRPGDVKHSLADINLAERLLGYTPEYDLARGLSRCAKWYAEQFLNH